MSQDRISSGKTTVYFHLPGLFEFYELYKRFLPLFLNIGNIFTNGAGSAPYTALRRDASGAGAVSGKEIRIRERSWRCWRSTGSLPV